VKRHVLVLGAMIAFYLAVTIAIGRFTTTDEIAFKAAGREWARSGHFAAPELTGFAHLQPPVEQVWLAHLPVYTFLFGLFVKLLGFGAWQSVSFDALIHAALSVLTFLWGCRMAPQASPWPAVLAAALVLPLGTFGRADELAVCLGMAALLLVYAARPRAAGSGVLFGVTAATSIVAAAFLGAPAVAYLLWKRRAKACAMLLLLAAVSFAACLASILIAHPTAWRQFGSHASAQFTTTIAWGVADSWVYGRHYLLSAAAALMIGISAAILRRKDMLIRFAPAFAVPIVICLVPAKAYYLWFVTPLLLAAACATAWELRGTRTMRLTTCFAAVLYAGAIAVPVQQQLIVALLPPDQQLAPNAAAVRAHVPRGSLVLASELWSSLANDVQYRSLVHGTTKIEDVDYVILIGNGSGRIGAPQTLDAHRQAALASDFTIVYDNLRHDVPRLFGKPLSRSGWGYGVRIYRSHVASRRSAVGGLQ
jgi:4-amino-4-deoxy-L-arabinose transferase-like glycosyltransferase